MQNSQHEHYWQALIAVHDRTRKLHRNCVAARDALFAHYGRAEHEDLEPLWQRYCQSVDALQDAVAETQTATGFSLPG